MPLHWQPVGPLPAATYWRRRAGVGAGVAVLLLVAGLAWPGGGSGPDRLQARATPSASPSPRPTAGAGAAAATPTPSTSAGAAACPNEALEVDVTTDVPTYPQGSTAVVTIGIKNTGTTPCLRAVEAGAIDATITSGSDRIWSSSDCPRTAELRAALLQPGQQTAVTVKWPGTRSAAGCPSGLPAPQPGTYRVTARVGDLSVPGPAFQVTG